MATGRIGVTPNLRTRWSKAPAGGTTSLSGLDDNSVSLVYDAGFEAVYRNGVLLSRGNDYTATNGTTITLVDATIAGDIIEVFANQAIPLTSTYTQAVADGKFINNTLVDAKGDILTATAADTPARLAVGTNNFFLGADSTTATGLKWLGDGISFTPTWTNLTVGNGSNVCRYIQIGKMVFVQGSVLFGTTTSISGTPSFTLPVNADVNNSYLLISHSNVSCIDWGSTEYVGYTYLDNSTTVLFRITNVAGTYPVRTNISATVPHTWANQDMLIYNFVYLGA